MPEHIATELKRITGFQAKKMRQLGRINKIFRVNHNKSLTGIAYKLRSILSITQSFENVANRRVTFCRKCLLFKVFTWKWGVKVSGKKNAATKAALRDFLGRL